MLKRIKYYLVFIGLLFVTYGMAGPPYDTDDPDPVLFHHWEAYISSHSTIFNQKWSGTAPHFELNYGIIPNMQLHIITPLAYTLDERQIHTYGYGDTEIGIKYRFLKETKYTPEVGTFIITEIPSGNSKEGLGSGSTQLFIPVWVQKTIGKLTAYGGYGQWVKSNTYKNNRFAGIQAQYQFTPKFSFGAELYCNTNNNITDSRFNLGCIIDLNKINHILISAGKSFNSNNSMECYIGV